MKGIQLVPNTLNGHQREKCVRRLDNVFCSLERQFLYLLGTLANPKCPLPPHRPREVCYKISRLSEEISRETIPISVLITVRKGKRWVHINYPYNWKRWTECLIMLLQGHPRTDIKQLLGRGWGEEASYLLSYIQILTAREKRDIFFSCRYYGASSAICF